MPILINVVLRLIILIIMMLAARKAYGWYVRRKARNTSAPAHVTAPEAAIPPPFPAGPSPAPVNPVAMVQSGVSGETVAAISAAVAVIMGDAGYKITNIQRKPQPRPVWAMAGLAQNTKQI